MCVSSTRLDSCCCCRALLWLTLAAQPRLLPAAATGTPQVIDILSFKQDPKYVGFDSCVEFSPANRGAEEAAAAAGGGAAAAQAPAGAGAGLVDPMAVDRAAAAAQAAPAEPQPEELAPAAGGGGAAAAAAAAEPPPPAPSLLLAGLDDSNDFVNGQVLDLYEEVRRCEICE